MKVTRIKVGVPVRKIKGDYRFEGIVVAYFCKLNGSVRVVVENGDGILHIFNTDQLEVYNAKR